MCTFRHTYDSSRKIFWLLILRFDTHGQTTFLVDFHIQDPLKNDPVFDIHDTLKYLFGCMTLTLLRPWHCWFWHPWHFEKWPFCLILTPILFKKWPFLYDFLYTHDLFKNDNFWMIFTLNNDPFKNDFWWFLHLIFLADFEHLWPFKNASPVNVHKKV